MTYVPHLPAQTAATATMPMPPGRPIRGIQSFQSAGSGKHSGPALVFTASEWAAFKDGMAKGEFDF
ncbi:DUF397 domain-containing protein [Nonomuraea sp. NPDC005650]|uniref:DUF397 domain-containing protein n=1 Tax=Nonomuraea sp. NPDC005650 TaxID=3157045 RepID=UPI0033B1B4D0